MKWKGKLINYLIEELRNDSKWGNTIEKILIEPSIGIHLAIFNEPFLSLIFKGEKKIESRFSINKISPFEKVKRGDVIILKESGGFVTGCFVAGEITFIRSPNKKNLDEIEKNYGERICSSYDKYFWKNRINAKYISLIEVKKIKTLTPFKSEKKDRTAWVVLREGISKDLFS